jgi:hypothetical protein
VSIIALFSWDILKPVLVAAALSWDSSEYLIDRYLQQFSSRIELSSSMYLVMALAVFLMVGITTALQVARTANTSPVAALRYE